MIIYGGSFNPVTKAHIDVANKVAELTGDKVYIVPCKHGKLGKEIIDIKHRITMINLCGNIDKNVLVSTFEQEFDSFSTYVMLKQIHSFLCGQPCYSGALGLTLKVLIGMDCAVNIYRWHNYKELIEEYPFIIIPRKGYSVEDTDWFLEPPHTYMSKVEVDNISSTEIRGAIKNNDKTLIKKYLDETVYKYILENNLYKD